jgi:hypothetical protein
MALLTYTTYAEIRATLGVSATELPDTTLALSTYGVWAQLALEDISLTLPTDYDTTVLLPVKTPDEQRFIDLVRLYVSYSTAERLLTSLPLFSVKTLTDGRASFTRETDPYKSVREGVLATLRDLRKRLAAAYAALFPAAVIVLVPDPAPTLVLASGLATDPVTGT